MKGNLDHIYSVLIILALKYKIDIFSQLEWDDSS
jgi:hypothetical protein